MDSLTPEDSSVPKKRGRKKGGKNKPKVKPSQIINPIIYDLLPENKEIEPKKIDSIFDDGDLSADLGTKIATPTKLRNGKITESQLFLYVPKHTLPEKEINRFLELCDTLIISLGPAELSETDIEEIALYYRDRIYADNIYSTFALSNTTDASLVMQIEKLNKGLEQRKTNLGARFIDKGKKRKEIGEESLIDLLARYSENKKVYEGTALEKYREISENKNTQFTNTSSYMEDHITTAQKLHKKEDE